MNLATQLKLQMAWMNNESEEDMAARTGLPMEMVRAYYSQLDAEYLSHVGRYPSQVMETMH